MLIVKMTKKIGRVSYTSQRVDREFLVRSNARQKKRSFEHRVVAVYGRLHSSFGRGYESEKTNVTVPELADTYKICQRKLMRYGRWSNLLYIQWLSYIGRS